MEQEIKISRDLLNNYQKTKREILLLEAELEEMLQGGNGIVSSTIIDYRNGFPKPQSIVGFNWQQREQMEADLARKKSEVRAVESWIGEIKDSLTRNVFRKYYLEGKTWERVAKELHIAGRARGDTIRINVRDAYLKKMEIK